MADQRSGSDDAPIPVSVSRPRLPQSRSVRYIDDSMSGGKSLVENSAYLNGNLTSSNAGSGTGTGTGTPQTRTGGGPGSGHSSDSQAPTPRASDVEETFSREAFIHGLSGSRAGWKNSSEAPVGAGVGVGAGAGARVGEDEDQKGAGIHRSSSLIIPAELVKPTEIDVPSDNDGVSDEPPIQADEEAVDAVDGEFAIHSTKKVHIGSFSAGPADMGSLIKSSRSETGRTVGFAPPSRDRLPDVHSEASEYYGGKQVWSRSRTYSNADVAGFQRRRPQQMGDENVNRNRRLSHDEVSTRAPRRFLIDVEETMRIILEQEDTNGDFQIAVHDSGPKLLSLGTASSNAYKSHDVRGTYMLSNLLQELALARDYGRKRIVLDEARLAENPVDRLSRMIKNSFWNSLTRRIDGDGLELICADPKNRSRHVKPLIYVPHGEPEMAEYYREVSRQKPKLELEVEVLPPKPDDPAFVKSLNERPGILALAMKKKIGSDGKTTFEGLPFVVPGARFNEFYYWDSYFSGLGLLVDGKREMAMNHVEHFIFEIKHYNKVLNGNRSYYLARSQPPFVTDLALQIFNQMPREMQKEHIPWLKRAMRAAIKEYHTYWMAEPALDTETGLSRYRPGGLGIPPETEATHFTHIIQPFAEKHGISVLDFIDQFNDREIIESDLDDYFMHDRAVRESGHDTTYRFEKRCANLATIDLNALLFKYEHDIATAIRDIFDDQLEMDEEFDLSPFPITREAFATGSKREKSTARIQTSQEWYERAAFRKQQIDRYLWNEGQSLYFDYDTKKKRQSRYESVTALWALWAGCASEHQADKMIAESLRKFEVEGGLVSGTEESRGRISIDRPNRQWDYPYGWPPHQIMAWVGLERYGYQEECHRLAYRWIYMMTTAFVDYNGVVPEKFDPVALSHLVDAEYGNQGLDFKCVNREGFAWTNASFQLGLHFLTTGMRRAVAACTPPEVYFRLKPTQMENQVEEIEKHLKNTKVSAMTP